MIAEVITIGDEILIGQIVDTNSAFIGKELNKVGVDVHQISSIRDEKKHILSALAEAQSRADIVIVTGGLGPTKDDITKHTFCEYFEDHLEMNQEVLEHVTQLFDKYITSPISEVNKMQALVPSKADVLHNEFGTAPGMWIEKEGTVFISMPGVPFEMKGILMNHAIPKIQERFDRPYILHKTILTYGMGESRLAEKIEDWEDNLPNYIKLAYLPNLGSVRLRLSARGQDKGVLELGIEKAIKELQALIGDIIVGFDEDESIEKVIADLLTKNKKTLSIAESCTGGRIAQSFTKNSGASAYFKGAAVTYATESKIEVLGVDKNAVDKHSVTSLEVAEAMALKVKDKFKSDYSIATTGNAGPNKGDGDVEVGTVFIAIATPNSIFSKKYVFSNSRERTIGKTVTKAMELLLNELM